MSKLNRVRLWNLEGAVPCWHFVRDEVTASQDFGIADDKGRNVGAKMHIWVDVYDALPLELAAQYAAIDAYDYTAREEFARKHAPPGTHKYSPYITDVAPGVYYSARPSATRAGVSFGAIQEDFHFRTIRERDDYVAKYFVDAKRRAVKQWSDK